MKAGCLQSNVYLSSPPTQGMAGLLHNTTGNHLRNKISSSMDGKGWCFCTKTSVRLPEVVFVWYDANPQPEGLWELVPDCCELWMTWLPLVDMNSKLLVCPQPHHYRNSLNSECLYKLQVLCIPMVRTE